MTDSPAYWAIVPAAGVGSRMGAEIPKQYLHLLGKPLIEHTLMRLLQFSALQGVIVAVSPYDKYWRRLPISRHPKVCTVEGGHERGDSVRNALRLLRDRLDKLDWVLVHDAARPCIQQENIHTLCNEVDEHLVGGILGIPVSDTIKRVNENFGIVDTVDRRALWRAQTPQIFRYGLLREALELAARGSRLVTDEASALEAMDYCPLMVEGRCDNIKVTRPEDLAMAELILHTQGKVSDNGIVPVDLSLGRA